MDPDAALAAAVEIYELFPEIATTPDATRARDAAHVRAAWRKLRTRLACPPDAPTLR